MTQAELSERVVKTVQQIDKQLDTLYARTMAAKEANPEAYEKLKKAYNALSYQQETLVILALNFADTVRKLNDLAQQVGKIDEMRISIMKTEFRKPF